MTTAAAWKPKTYREQVFKLKGLDGISDAQIAEHLSLYSGYVKQVNQLNEELAGMLGRGQASGKNSQFAELTRRLGFEYNGMILQSTTSPIFVRPPTPNHPQPRGWPWPWATPSAQCKRGRPTSTPSARCAGLDG